MVVDVGGELKLVEKEVPGQDEAEDARAAPDARFSGFGGLASKPLAQADNFTSYDAADLVDNEAEDQESREADPLPRVEAEVVAWKAAGDSLRPIRRSRDGEGRKGCRSERQS